MATEREKKKRIIGCNEIFLRLPWQNLYKRYEAVINVIVHFFYCANAVRDNFDSISNNDDKILNSTWCTTQWTYFLYTINIYSSVWKV